jgi:hypothetical protein
MVKNGTKILFDYLYTVAILKISCNKTHNPKTSSYTALLFSACVRFANRYSRQLESYVTAPEGYVKAVVDTGTLSRYYYRFHIFAKPAEQILWIVIRLKKLFLRPAIELHTRQLVYH